MHLARTSLTRFSSAAALTFAFALGACRGADPATANPPSPAGPSDGAATPPAITELAITVDGAGYHPDNLRAPAGKPVRLKFTRVSDSGCGQQVLFPSLKLQKDLPLNREVVVEVTMPSSGRLDFTCGMGMLRGTLIAQP